jgi:hypothetical protein
MIIKLLNVKENPDGSADMEIEYDQEGKQILLERGVMAILEDFIKEKKHEPQPKRRKASPAVIQSNKRNNIKRRDGVV